ncbi:MULTISPECIES: N-carbamoylsarcosine amidohydrolase [Rhizobium]|jgi:maleamate amidohydrolase|uniref:Maleamate amidohydrolase n=1 Tax=Rhizobium miluonense TaxID=411945 RepID=A0ABU1SVU7_9HYPH|nr:MULTISPECIES: N-carbamoylsarcosine amidohydrolase [Rhizobium]MBB3383252.1 maleamate amidohydrolase [Rhizobium sp. BK098]MBB3424083.1 maleamate amidohydrolase [Rhizobium sp. BK312]MBB3615443.1 maleamate amidohydrolase [Rhizobium sp. BK609]MBB3681103.1 maleamate amidohydrolase [Rhizobium sp. BK612]MDR6903070.1 maleamate amidohydrolase [Rhizobium miluonense]
MQTAEANYQGVWGNRIGFGQRPALVVIDFLKAYTIEGAPLYAPGVVEAVAQTPALIASARASGIPVIHTRILYLAENCADGGMWVKKSPVMKAMVEGNVLAEFCEGVEPAAGELVIVKQYASAFFGTSLASHLHAQGIDTVIMAGCSTSGCIRASAVDAVQHGFRAIVVRDCVGDRHPDPHNANLFDIDSKYGDVVSREEAITEIAKVKPNSP